MDTIHIPQTMLACQVVKFNKPYMIQEVTVPQDLEPDDILVRMGAASFCHTDEMVRAGIMQSKLPITASHEGAGMVVATGISVKDFQIGDRALSGVIQGRCGKCIDCGSEDTQYCSSPRGGIGMRADGAFAEYMRCDAREAGRIPSGLTCVAAAPLACAGLSAWRALKLLSLTEGQWLGIVGSGGGLGHLCLKFAKAKGLKVAGIDARDEGLKLTQQLGADMVADARQNKAAVVEQVLKATKGESVSGTINVSDADTAVALSCAITARHGNVVQVAQPPEIKFPFSELIFRDIKIIGSLTGSQKDLQEMLEFAATHGISPEVDLFNGLDQIPQLLEAVQKGRIQGKGVVVIDQDIH